MQAHRIRGAHTTRSDDTCPLDVEWLDRKATAYAARWETTKRGVSQILERKVRERCERTGERPDAALAMIPAVVDRLVERNYVNDERAAQQLLDRLRRQGRSKAQIRLRMLQKGVPESIVDALSNEVEPESELEAAWKTARKRRLGPHCGDPERRLRDRDRHLAVLARQGFSLEIAQRVVDAEHSGDHA